VFGQTEGLLGDELDLRDLQQSSKVGRIDVQISSENGQSFGVLTIATSLDKAETAILGASLETIERVGPCRADIEVTEIEDVRAAKRRAVVDRAKELLATAFDETIISTEELVTDVRESVRVEDLVEYAGLPAGPSVESSDAIIVVEGRADVRQLLKYGIKNAIAVEGTDVPAAVADLTAERTTTVFVDGDRGGELILRELFQVGDVDFVADGIVYSGDPVVCRPDDFLAVPVVRPRGNRHLDRGVAGFHCACRVLGHFGRLIAADPLIERDRIPRPSPKQLVDGRAELQSLDIPERLIDPRDGAREDRPATVVTTAVTPLPVPLDFRRVASQNEVLD